MFDHSLNTEKGSGESAETDGDRSVTSGDAAYDEAFAELAQIIAHRIRSLTSSIESCADMLSDVVDGRDERELVLRILEGTARIEYVLSDLMLYGKPIHPTYLPLYIEDVLQGVLSLLSEDERQQIEFVGDLPKEVQVPADPNLLQQALLALVQNALDAIEEGTDESRWVRIEADYDTHDETVSVSVTNPGTTGLPQAHDQIFRPFFTTKAQNLGLGLSIARRIIETHEGVLDLTDDDAETGTRFEMRLPADEM